MAPRSIPIEPDAETARQWVVDELAKDAYDATGRSWLQRFLDWVASLFDGVGEATGNLGFAGVPGAVVAILLAVLLVALIVFIVWGPMRASRRRKASHAVFEDDVRDSKAMRSAAERAAARGDWTLAVIERFRGIVRDVEQAGWVAVFPGMTAYEFVTQAGERVPALTSELDWAGDLFDRIRYGHDAGSRAHYERMVALDSATASARVVGATA
ncbi:DUF4129 domain-containing protein [Demequina sp.]|uniref:DUF4129 domain-containing protein n=1 Tax=Demequina sp. TaxID=2050685 RepID=UPI0025C28376|nr:DUF4129 domain-containing protein [Demequina sp.]